ncbi:hypothetical protein Poly51_48730 [Rubripirellula tenax]|uniref:Uncharacterized protein n=1 Tax=Rubripirellula tenax TaxID=2528015 RepID=A0A5C6ENN3_9BACT|nr:hypothetical protein Poly51_48730 [Rubripirellula tenax]
MNFESGSHITIACNGAAVETFCKWWLNSRRPLMRNVRRFV